MWHFHNLHPPDPPLVFLCCLYICTVLLILVPSVSAYLTFGWSNHDEGLQVLDTSIFYFFYRLSPLFFIFPEQIELPAAQERS